MALEMAKNILPMILKYMEFTSQYMGYHDDHGDTDHESMEISSGINITQNMIQYLGVSKNC